MMVTGRTRGRRAFNVFNVALLSLLGVIFLLPYLMIVSASFTSNAAFLHNGYALFPSEWSFEAYATVFTKEFGVPRALGNSILLTVVGTCIHVATTTFAAYPLSKKHLVGGGILMKLIIFSMLFSGGLIPTYMLITSLGLKNSIFAIILPGMLAPWHCILIRNYFRGLPTSLEEAAKIDGSKNFRIFWQIYLPISVPVVASIVLFTAVAFWNNWSGPVLYYDSAHADMLPLTALLQNMLQENISPSGGAASSINESVKMATVVVSTLPIIIVYPFVQKYFVTGLTLGSVKG